MKRLLIVFISIFLMNIICFAKSGGNVDLVANLGASYPVFTQSGDNKLDIKPEIAFEWGIYIKPTGYIDLGPASIGLSLDLGYQRDIFAYTSETGKGNLSLDNLVIGLTPKINSGIITFGIGGGVKFPLGGSDSFTERIGTTITENYNYRMIKDKYNNTYIPYIITSFDVTLSDVLIVGIYASYDIPLFETKTSSPNIKYSAIDFGATIGLSL